MQKAVNFENFNFEKMQKAVELRELYVGGTWDT
jgi:hypothetical protein